VPMVSTHGFLDALSGRMFRHQKPSRDREEA